MCFSTIKMNEEIPKVLPILNKIDSKIKWILEKPVVSLSLIGITALLFRLYFLPDLPFTQDAIAYFQFSNDLIILQNFPNSFSYLESGWPIFLSIFISIFQLGIKKNEIYKTLKTLSPYECYFFIDGLNTRNFKIKFIKNYVNEAFKVKYYSSRKNHWNSKWII